MEALKDGANPKIFSENRSHSHVPEKFLEQQVFAVRNSSKVVIGDVAVVGPLWSWGWAGNDFSQASD